MAHKYCPTRSFGVTFPLTVILIALTAPPTPIQSAVLRPQNEADAVPGAQNSASPETPVTSERDSSTNWLNSVAVMQNSPPSFVSGAYYDSGGAAPWGIAVADLNGDGNADAVVASFNTNTLGVLLGNGHGWFGPPLTYGKRGRGGSQAVAIGDLNADGKPDIVVGDYYEGSECGLGVLLGRGDGTFVPSSVPGICRVSAVVIADLNGDGMPDVVLAQQIQENVGVLLGNGGGTFRPLMTYNWGNGQAASWGSNLSVSDVNGDGNLDLVVATGTSPYPFGKGTVSVLLGNGDGTFQSALEYNSGGLRSLALTTGDFNRDGKIDIAVLNGDTLGVLLGHGDGTFQSPVIYDSGAVSSLSVAVADVNRDGLPDLVVANLCTDSACKSGSVGVLLGNGDGTFQPVVIFPGSAKQVAVADVNGDGRPDVVFTKGSAPVIGLLLSKAGIATHTSVTTSGSPTLAGEPVTFTATVRPTTGTIPEREMVAFYDGTKMVGAARLASGKATYTMSPILGKTHSIKATYVGDETFRLGSGSVSQVVLKETTVTVLASNANPSTYGQPVTFTATVTSSGPTPTGKVKFFDEMTGLGAVTLSNGIASITKLNLARGRHQITAEYLGDASSAQSASSVLNQVVK